MNFTATMIFHVHSLSTKIGYKTNKNKEFNNQQSTPLYNTSTEIDTDYQQINRYSPYCGYSLCVYPACIRLCIFAAAGSPLSCACNPLIAFFYQLASLTLKIRPFCSNQTWHTLPISVNHELNYRNITSTVPWWGWTAAWEGLARAECPAHARAAARAPTIVYRFIDWTPKNTQEVTEYSDYRFTAVFPICSAYLSAKVSVLLVE